MSARDPGALVVGIGQEAAGDDAIGLLVARAVASQGIVALESTDATVLLAHLLEGRRVVLVDAVAGTGKPGDVLHLRSSDLADGHTPVSSHGIGVAEALALVGVLHGPDALHAVDIVGVVIEAEPRIGSKVSPAVAAAVRPAAALVARLARPRR